MPTADEQLTRWLAQIKSQTYSKTLPLGVLLFEPEEETAQLLTQWLRFRNYPPATLAPLPHSKLAQMAKADMGHHGNSPPFTQFVYFDPTVASEEFLVMWLSWFGITSVQVRSKAWWVQLSQKIQSLLHSFHAPESNPHLLFLNTAYADRLLEQGKAQLSCTHSILESLAGGSVRSVRSVRNVDQSRYSDRVSLAKHSLAHLLGIATITIPIIRKYHDAGFLSTPQDIVNSSTDSLRKKLNDSYLKTFLDQQDTVTKFARLLGERLIGHAQAMIITHYLLWIMGKFTKRAKNPIIHDYAVAVTRDIRQDIILPTNLIGQVITDALGVRKKRLTSPIGNIAYQTLSLSTLDAMAVMVRDHLGASANESNRGG